MRSRAILAAVLLLASPAVAAESFETVVPTAFPEQYLAPDARSEGMGLAFTAVAEGPAGLWWNPATQLEGRRLTVGYHTAEQSLDLIDFTALSAAVEVGYLRLGAYQNLIAMDDVEIITAYLPEDPDGPVDLRTRTRAAGLALDLGRLMFGDETTLFASAGINFKSFSTSTDGDVTSRAGDHDVGLIVGTRLFLGDSDDDHRGWVGWRLGAVLTDTDESAVEYPGGGATLFTSPHLRQHARVGLALEGRHGWRYGSGHALRWLLAADWEKAHLDDGWDDETGRRYGAEVTLLGLVSGRIGRIDRGGDDIYDGTTYGAGLRLSLAGGRLGLRGDWASVPFAPGAAAGAARRLDRVGAAAWLHF